ncbi:hypothetical protein OG439_14380 [Amycolatopsis sp. NBC_01307]|uniref:hypothetical protein n=1 Tax=Amycolatopsis sp. NBC_01307 TaxID=2903561 RepID=UPI002E160CD8|nr:hypothetical protein OG439_14380 [Amycolatopsis sp. NBC_01307]
MTGPARAGFGRVRRLGWAAAYDVVFDGPAWPWWPTAVPAGLVLLGVAGVVLVIRQRRRMK